MTRLQSFKLPDLGEGLTEGEILQWMVAPGDEVTLNQVIVEVETAKAAVEVPSPYAGTVHQIHHPAGATVDVGAPIITFDTDPTAGPLVPEGPAEALAADMVPRPSTADRPSADDSGPQGALIGEVGANGRTATLVGYGPKSVTAQRRPRIDGPGSTVSVPSPAGATRPAPARVSALQVGQTAALRSGALTVLVKPPVRKLAKELGVDLTVLRGTGTGGVVTRADVQAAADLPQERPHDTGPAVPQQDSYDPATRETRVPVKGVRKHTAAAMVASAFTAPHVTEFVTLDMTATMQLRERVQAMPEMRDVKVSPLLFVAKALLLAVARNPGINASWDEAAQEIVVKDYVHLGIAAATPRGLLVPTIRDADRLSLPALATALQELAETARAGRTPPAAMTGGTITITNVGMFGVDSGTPILNPGEAAILCLGAVRPRPWVVEAADGTQAVEVRQVTQLSLSFDHRMVDGQLGSQFLSDVAAVLSDPVHALLWS
ncbi:MAG: Dihydrolipoyllysine-residue acetyltransferase [Frankiales bacterium]|nr:Dihydrolipoyllysine-residue acetyltransferase [Frankiales bacterium]